MKRKWFIIAAAVTTPAVMITTYLLLRNPYPLPKAIVRDSTFPVYYPNPLPDGISYQQDSAKRDHGVLTYNLHTGSQTIHIFEQTAPSSAPDLDHLPGFSHLQIPAGKAAIGQTLNRPVAIILSNTTIINISGDTKVPSDVVTSVAKAMRSLPQ